MSAEFKVVDRTANLRRLRCAFMKHAIASSGTGSSGNILTERSFHLAAWAGVLRRAFGHRARYLLAERDGRNLRRVAARARAQRAVRQLR